MPERKHHEFAFLDAVIQEVANATKVQATNPGNPGVDYPCADARLPKQQAECRLKVFAERFGRRKPVLQPPAVGHFDLRRGA